MEHIKEEFELLLLKDLCARAPYGVKIYLETPKYGELIGTLDAVYPTEGRVIVDNLDKAIAPFNVRCGGFKIEENKVKPYLRPMSNMTEEEKEEVSHLLPKDWSVEIDKLNNFYFDMCPSIFMEIDVFLNIIDWLNAHHFDYRGLIEKGLAIPEPAGMYDNEQNK